MCQIDWSALAQMLTALAAIVAIGLGPWLSFRVSQRAAVSQFRQSWLDGIRDDISQIVALHEDVVLMRIIAELNGDPEPKGPEMMQIRTLLSRVRMRLNIDRSSHRNLLDSINLFISCYDQEDEDFIAGKVMKAFDPVKREVWDDVKAGRI